MSTVLYTSSRKFLVRNMFYETEILCLYFTVDQPIHFKIDLFTSFKGDKSINCEQERFSGEYTDYQDKNVLVIITYCDHYQICYLRLHLGYFWSTLVKNDLNFENTS